MQRAYTIFFLLLAAVAAWASEATISGTVADSLGAVIPDAGVALVEKGKDVANTRSDAAGRFHFTVAHAGRYLVRAEAEGFAASSSTQVVVEPGHNLEVSLRLSPSAVAQNIVVTATAIPTPEAQTGTSISVIDGTELATRSNVDQALRDELGAQVVQSGPMGAVSSLFVRGGPSDANKVLLDGVPLNDIGGAVDFSSIQADGFDRVEFQRGPNSTLYGSDALAGVISITTRRGATPLPLFSYAADGGSFGSYHQDGSISGYCKRLDYFTGYSGFGTQNNLPNSQYHRDVYLGNLGYQITPSTTLRLSARRVAAGFNSANAVAAYGIPDAAATNEGDTSFSAALENRAAGDRWHTLLQYGGLRLRRQFNDYAPTGIPYDPYGLGYPSYYLGLPLPQQGANGYVITPAAEAQVEPSLAHPGQAIYQYAGDYPQLSSYFTNSDFVYSQTDYRFSQKLATLFGFRYSNERGFTYNGFTGRQSTERNNFSYSMEVQGGLWGRLFYALGGGIEDNAIFGVAGTPRVSLAYYLKRPGGGIFSGTRLSFNFAKGIKEPSIYYEKNSLYELLSDTSIVPGGPGLIARYHIHPFRAEQSRSYDGGVEQQLLAGKARVSAIYFHNEFTNQAEYVSSQNLVQLGVPAEVAQALGFFGAAVNSLDYRAQGAELGFQYRVQRNLMVRGGWTYTDAVVQQSFASSALAPAINPLFPNILIGAYSPLVGGRPFRIAPHTAFAGADLSFGRWLVSAMATFVSRRDDSTFLSDTDFGNTLLLPNRNLDAAYQKIDLYGSYQLSKRLSAYSSLENLLNEHYQQVYGFPALPFTVRAGMKFTFGGESWKLN